MCEIHVASGWSKIHVTNCIPDRAIDSGRTILPPPIREGDPFAARLNSPRSWRRVLYHVDTRVDPEKFDDPLHEIRFYSDMDD